MKIQTRYPQVWTELSLMTNNSKLWTQLMVTCTMKIFVCCLQSTRVTECKILPLIWWDFWRGRRVWLKHVHKASVVGMRVWFGPTGWCKGSEVWVWVMGWGVSHEVGVWGMEWGMFVFAHIIARYWLLWPRYYIENATDIHHTRTVL